MKSLPTQDQEMKKVRFTCWHLQLLFKRNSPEQREGERGREKAENFALHMQLQFHLLVASRTQRRGERRRL